MNQLSMVCHKNILQPHTHTKPGNSKVVTASFCQAVPIPSIGKIISTFAGQYNSTHSKTFNCTWFFSKQPIQLQSPTMYYITLDERLPSSLPYSECIEHNMSWLTLAAAVHFLHLFCPPLHHFHHSQSPAVSVNKLHITSQSKCEQLSFT